MNLEKYLTASQIRNLETRRAVALALEAGYTYAQIVEELRVSTATVSKVARLMRERKKNNDHTRNHRRVLGFSLALLGLLR